MNKLPLLAVLLIASQGFAQCPFPARLNTTGSCLGTTLSVVTSGTLTQIVWYNGTAAVATTATIPPNASYKPATAGVYTAMTTDNTGCQTTTNAVTVDPSVTPGISITQTAATVCTDQPIFTALATNGGTLPAYQWKVNSQNAGHNSPVYKATAIPPHAVVSCLLTSSAVCATSTTAASPTIVVKTPPPVTLSSKGNNCPGDLLLVSASDPLTQITWNEGSTALTTVYASPGPGATIDTSYTAATAGPYTATATNDIGCTATTNQIIVKPNVTPVVTIGTPAAAVCKGSPLTFKASPADGGTTPVYQWQVNGVNTGLNSASYSSAAFAEGDAISCAMTSNADCALPATVLSNTIPLTVNPLPQLDTGQIFYLASGQSVTISPIVTGNYSYLWSPGTGLSDSMATAPIASPTKTTVYTLTATSSDGCEASTAIIVDVFTKLQVPNAFTPNGDGHNDIFYILNGPPDSRIRDLSVYDRWGEKVFQVHNVPTADPAFGWNGKYKDAPAPAGAYIYALVMSFADGTQQVFQGSILLIR
jgi:gliding motility-associated-like protein